MVGLTGAAGFPLRPPVPAPWTVRPQAPGPGQRGLWLAHDWTLLGLTIVAMADMPNRWGLAGPVWLCVYAAFLLRVAPMWPAFFGQIARNRLLLAYPLVCLLSVLWSGSPATSLAGGVQIVMSALIAIYLGWRFAPGRLMAAMLVLVTAAAVLSLANRALGLWQPVLSYSGGLLGIYTNKNMLGHYSAMAALMGITVALMGRGEAPALLRRLAPVAVLVCVAAVGLSRSMTAVLLLPCYCALLLVLNRRRLPAALRHGAVAGGILLVGLGPLALAVLGIDPLAELFRATGKDATLTGRTELWAIASDVIAQAPLTGQGFGAFWVMDRFEPERFAVLQAGATAPSFHDFMADILVGTGLVGLAAMALLLGTVLSRAVRQWRAEPSAVATACLVTALMPMTVGLVETYMYRQHEFMLMWVIMLAASIRAHQPPFAAPSRPAGATLP